MPASGRPPTIARPAESAEGGARHPGPLGSGHPAAPSGKGTVPTPARGGDEVAVAPRGRAALKALARARRHHRLLNDGRHASISEMAGADGDLDGDRPAGPS
jgi:hypothetical protein